MCLEKLGFIMLNTFCLIYLYTTNLDTISKQRFSFPWLWMFQRYLEFSFLQRCLQHRILSDTTAEGVESRWARLGREGSSTKKADTKLVVLKRLSPFCHWKRVSKTSPSHKIVAEVNLFGQEALRYCSKYCQKLYKWKILTWYSLDTNWSMPTGKQF